MKEFLNRIDQKVTEKISYGWQAFISVLLVVIIRPLASTYGRASYIPYQDIGNYVFAFTLLILSLLAFDRIKKYLA